MNISDTFSKLPASRQLANGVSAFFRKTLPSGLVSIQVWVKTGSIHEAEFLGGGLSHYLEHMVFKGTEKFSAEEITRRVQAVGGNINAYTTFSRTVYYIDVPAESAEIAFEILSQLTLKPRLDALDAAREKDVILREIDMGNDDPDSKLSDATLAETFRVHPYRVPVIGYKSVFSQMTAKELRAYYEKRYTPQNLSLVVAGDIEEEIVFALAEKYFSEAPAKPSPEVFIPSEPPQLAPREITLRGNVNILRGNLLWKIPGVAHEDVPALSVLAALLGKGDSSLLWQELHEKRGIVHAVDVSAWTPSDIGLFWISYVAESGSREKTETALRSIIDRISAEGVPPSLLKKVSRQALVGLVNSLATASSSAARLGSECVERGDPAATSAFLEKINALLPEDIARVARKYLKKETATASAFEKFAPKATRPVKSFSARASAAHAFPPFEEIRLASGVRVLLQPVSGFPKVHLRASLLGGSAFETEKTRGATALLSTLMTLDAGTRTASEIAEAIESVGGNFDEISGNNTFSLFANTLSGDEKIACEILSDAVCAPRFSEENFERERVTQLAALRSEFDEIEEYARLALREKFFGKHALGTHNFGTVDALESIKLSDIRKLYSRLVVPENLVIAASGEFERDALLCELEKYFSEKRFCAGSSPSPSAEAFEAFSPLRSRNLEISPPAPAEQAIVQLAFPDLGFCDERYLVGTLTEELLSGMSSRLFLEVREKRGLAYFVGANRICSPRTGMFFLYAGTHKAQKQIVLEEMQKELERLRAGKISSEEILGAKTRICVARRTARQRAASRCGNAALNSLYGLPVNRDEETESRLGALTADDVARFATEILAPDFALALSVC